MNEFDWEVLQRKRIAQQARYRKNGSKSKKCSLPSDRMSQKQWKERNGEIVSVRMNRPMSWKDFKKLSRDSKQLYISTLQDLYGASYEDLGRMFGVTGQGVKGYLKRAGVVSKPTRSYSKEHRELWERFLNSEPEREPATHQAAEAPELPEEIAPSTDPVVVNFEAQEAAEPPRKAGMLLDSFTLQFSGGFDPEAIRNSLAMILQKGQQVRIQINCTVEG